MKFEIRTPGFEKSRTPGGVFKRWLVIGAIVGALLVGIAGALIVGSAMVAGAFFGAIAGAVIGGVNAAITAVRGN